MTHATSRGGSTGYSKPGQTVRGAAGKGKTGMRQTFKRTGRVDGLKASGATNNAGRAPVAPTGARTLHVGNPY